MNRSKMVALGIAGVVLPVVLVFSAYVIASGAISAAGSDVPPVPQNRVTETTASRPVATPSETARTDDRGGKCSEPEHQNDPECVSETPSEGPDNSGPGSGPDRPGEEDADNSGPGSSNSGPGSGSGGDD